ncbi:MAG: glycosyl hydrolase [Elusimicrobia bacterium]|nr:glycosyl hydrolase [Elusimicrobiota bacterium]
MKKKYFIIFLAMFFTVIGVMNAATPLNPNMIHNARNLLNYIYSIEGNHILSGQFGYLKSTVDGMLIDDKIASVTGGKMSAIREYGAHGDNGSNVSFDSVDNTVVKIKADWNSYNRIPEFSWHMSLPPLVETMDTSQLGNNADYYKLVTPGTTENTSFISKLDFMAVRLKQLQDLGIPVLWRPFHEMQGTGFWWSFGGDPIKYKNLWKYMYNYYTNVKGLNNLIWIWAAIPNSSYNAGDFYPGDQYVDIAGYDLYGLDANDPPSMYDYLLGKYNTLKSITSKPSTLSENDVIPDPAQLDQRNINFVWFLTWQGTFLSTNSNARLNYVYNHPYVITAGNALAILKSVSTDTTPPAKINTLTSSVATSNRLLSCSVALNWTTVGDDGNTGTASGYDIRYATFSITSNNWDDISVTKCGLEPLPLVAGSNQSYTVNGLSGDTVYYFAMKVGDEVPNWSDISNTSCKTNPTPTNLALNKTATSSSVDASFPTSQAVDGDAKTYWLAGNWNDSQWINIDLGATYGITEVVLRWYELDPYITYATSYEIQISANGTDWTTIYPKTGGTGGTEDIQLNGSGRFVRMYEITRSGSYRLGLPEFEVYGGTPVPDTTPPSDITTLASGVSTSNSVVLSWTTVGDDGKVGTASVYDIRYANVNITDSNWATATQCSGKPAPLVAGNNQSYTVQGLSAGITYYFGMKVRDESNNWSGLSNIASRATNELDTNPPADIKTLATGSATSNSIALSWTSVGDDGNIGTASVYDIRYATYSISSSNWDSAGVTQCSGVPTPQISGTLQSYIVQGLSAGITYFFAMKVGDEVPNWSGVSNLVSGQVNSQGNIAIGKQATASSEEAGLGNDNPNYVTDGKMGTRWSSEYSDLQWIKIDLVDTYNINQVVLRWDPAYGKDYQLQVSSNDINWTQIYTKTNGTGGVDTLSGLSGSGRYIRMYGTARGSVWGYSLWEFEVYGTSGTTPTKSITITYPNGGENLIAGSQQTVTWTSAGGVGNVMIQISEDGGTNWSTLIPNTANDGSEIITLPNSASSNCLIRLVAISGGTTDTSNANFAITVTGQMSFGNNGNPWQIGVAISTIEAENYDTGGEDVAYHDTTPGNSGGAYRTNEDVDVEGCTDTGGGYDIGNVMPSEWLEYSIDVNETAEYKLILRGAMQGTASPFHLEFGPHNGTAYRITPSVTIPNTGGWQIWQDVEISSNTTLTAGNQIMKLVMDTGAGSNNGNFNYIKIIRLSADTTPPIISNITVPTGTLTGNSVTLTWTTNELSNSKVEYGLTTSYGSVTPVTDTGGIYNHSVTLSGLTENTTYHYRIVSVDMSANTTISGDYSFTTILNDPNPPVISNITVSVTQTSAIITWNTDENSDSQVTYGTTTAMGATTALDSGMNRLHSVPLSGLLKGNTYYYMVYSHDSSGNLATSLQYSFKTYNNNIKHRIYTYYYDDGTTTTKIGASASASLKFLVQVYNVDENSLATDYTGILTLTTKNNNNSILDTTDSTLTVSDAGEKEVSIPFRSNINTVELTGDVTAPVVINFSDMYISKLVGYQGGSIRGANGLKILIPTGVLSTNKYLAAIPTRVPPTVSNTTKYVNTKNPICYDFGELSFGGGAESAPTLQNQVFARSVNITIPYTAADIGTLNEDGLRIYYWTGTDWDLVTGVQTVDKINNTVTATVKHFSTYRILGSYVSTDLSDIKIYPNPYNPDTAAQGKLKVINLPTNSVMKLYSVDGELIRELKERDFGNLGWLEWDGKNADGDKVARAVYIYQIEDTSGGKKTGKIGLVK